MLSEYLEAFASGDLAANANPVQTGLVVRKVADLQNILIRLGWKATTIPRPGAKDFGLFGPKTAGAWAQSAGTRKLNPTFQRASSTEAYVDPTTLSALSGGAAPSPAAAVVARQAQAPTAMPVSQSVEVAKPVSEVFALLYKIGWTTKKLPRSSKYTPALASAWGISAKSRRVNTSLRASSSPTIVLVDSVAYTAIAADASKQAVAQGAPAVDKVVAGTAVKTVAELQDLLYGVGWTSKKLKKDGLYGSQTKGAWGTSAKTRKLPVMFDRVDGTHARVAQATYDKIAADAAKSGVAPVVAPGILPGEMSPKTPVANNVPAGDMIDKPVADVQNVLIKLGWKSTTIPRPGAKDFGLFGPKTKGAWEASTKQRKLDSMFVRVDGKTVRVKAKSYIALLEETQGKGKAQPAVGGDPNTRTPAWVNHPELILGYWVTTSGTQFVVTKETRGKEAKTFGPGKFYAKGTEPKPGTPSAPSTSADKLTVAVSEMQSIVIALGEPKTKSITDGKFGPATQKAWEKAALARKLNSGVSRVNATKAQVSSQTYQTLKAEAQGKPAPKPSVLDTETLAADTAQSGLNILAGSKLKVDGTWGNKTETALRGWLNKQPGGKSVKIVVASKKAHASSVKLPQAFVAILRDASKAAPAPTPANDTEKAVVAAVIKRATVTVPVLAVQRTLAIAQRAKPSLPTVALTGTWSPETQEGFLSFLVESDALRPGWRMALPKLVSSDNARINVWPEMEAPITTGNKLWLERPAVEQPPAPEPPVAGPVITTMPSPSDQPVQPTGPGPAPTTPQYATGGESAPGVPDGGGVAPGGGGPEQPGGEAPAPPPGAPAAADPGAVWDGAVAALSNLGTQGPQLIQAVEAAKASGGTIRPEVEQVYEAWLTAAEKLKQRVGQIVEGSPDVMAALDAAAPAQTAVAGFMSGLEAYLGELSSASSEVLDILKTPIITGPVPSLNGLGQVGPVIGWAARLAGAAWPKLLQLLQLPVVRSAVVTYIGVKGVGSALNADTQNYTDTNQQLNQYVVDKKLTVEEAQNLKEGKPLGPWPLIIAGVVGLGGLALYLKDKRQGPTSTRQLHS